MFDLVPTQYDSMYHTVFVFQLKIGTYFFMKMALVSIIINKKGDTSDKNHDKIVALVTAASKIFKSVF